MTRSLQGSPIRVVAPGRSLTLVAGLPGAGKSTLLRGLAQRAGLAVLDSETQRRALSMLLPARTPYLFYRPVVHLLHRAAIVQRAFGRTDSVVVHLPATGPGLRRLVRALARVTGRTAHLVWIEVSIDEAVEGQRRRGRTLNQRSFARHARRAAQTARRLLEHRLDEGWSSSVVIDRAEVLVKA
jgi:predicted kinase